MTTPSRMNSNMRVSEKKGMLVNKCKMLGKMCNEISLTIHQFIYSWFFHPVRISDVCDQSEEIVSEFSQKTLKKDKKDKKT